jgi:hypothetical protein
MCKRLKAKFVQPLMGDLPLERLDIKKPAFTNIIIDVCGPVVVRIGRKSEKRWLLVINCLTTRASHIEILYKMDTNDCLMSLQNFINLRGCPSKIYSDPGTNFVGAMNITKHIVAQWNVKLLQKGIVAQKIEWILNPPKGSHFNGAVEKVIDMTKKILKFMFLTLNKKFIFPNDAILRCLICEAINMLNSRPLVFDENEDSYFLTPNHFIMGHAKLMPGPSDVKDGKNLLKDWEDIKNFQTELWKFFEDYYIDKIKLRSKWHKPQENLKVGDVVITSDPTTPNVWRVGKLIEITTGSKDQVRKVKLILGKNELVTGSTKNIMENYKNEKCSIIERPASKVAKFL